MRLLLRSTTYYAVWAENHCLSYTLVYWCSKLEKRHEADIAGGNAKLSARRGAGHAETCASAYAYACCYVACVREILTNWQFAACGVCYLSASLLWMYIVKYYPLSQSYPMVSLSFVFGMIAAMLVFHESIDAGKWLGVVLIILGCILIAR